MQQPLPTGAPILTGPTFYLTSRERIRPGTILLAIVIAFSLLSSILYGLSHIKPARLSSGSPGADRSASSASAAPPDDKDDKDDPSQVDTIVLGDPADAPVPARRGDHVSPVHPTIIVHLPRFGEQVGLIPDTPAGHLLYTWLAAFNQASYPALANALPNAAPDSAVAAQMELRRHTGGFNLVSAKEVQPGVLVFRLRDQTPSGNEVLGTLQVRPDSSPAAIASFSLRAVPSPGQNSPAGTTPSTAAPPK
jgi:hypothetical protein